MSTVIDKFCPHHALEHVVAVAGVSRGPPLDQISGEFYKVGKQLGAIRGGRCLDDEKLCFFTFETQDEARAAIEHIHNATLGIRLATDSKCLKATYGFTAGFFFAGSPPCDTAGNFVTFRAVAVPPAPASGSKSPAATLQATVSPIAEAATSPRFEVSPTPVAHSLQLELSIEERQTKRRRLDDELGGAEEPYVREQSIVTETAELGGDVADSTSGTVTAQQIDANESMSGAEMVEGAGTYEAREADKEVNDDSEKVTTSETGRNAKAAQDRNEGIVTAAGTSADGYCTSFSVAFPSHTVRVDLYGERGLPLAIKEADALLIQGISNACFNFEEPKMLGTDLKTISRVLDIPLKSLQRLVVWPGRTVEGEPRSCIKLYLQPSYAGDVITNAMSAARCSVGRNGKPEPVNSVLLHRFRDDYERRHGTPTDSRGNNDRYSNNRLSDCVDSPQNGGRRDARDHHWQDDRWARFSGERSGGGRSYSANGGGYGGRGRRGGRGGNMSGGRHGGDRHGGGH